MKENFTSQARGFSAVELLVCLALVAMLAAIAVPNFMVASTAADVSQAKADMRALKVGLEAYKVDGGAYPWQCGFPSALQPFPISGGTNQPTLERLTTPISYLGGATPFYDPFQADKYYRGADANTEHIAAEYEVAACKLYWYHARNLKDTSAWGQSSPHDVDPFWYLLESAGPDQHHHFIYELLNPWASDTAEYRAKSGDLIYDPTNGAVSRGSIWDVGGDVQGRGSSFGLAIIDANSSRVSDWDKYR